MRIEDILGNNVNHPVVESVLDEACRQWYSMIEDAPERQDGEDFASFFKEVFIEKADEYLEEYAQECREAKKAALPMKTKKQHQADEHAKSRKQGEER